MSQIYASERSQAAPASRVGSLSNSAQGPDTRLAKLQAQADQSATTRQLVQLQAQQTAQRMEEEELMQGKGLNANGMPAPLQHGVESLSGTSMADVKVHYNSDKPGQLQAHAYAQGTDIHLAQGQEQHLPHEAWHVAQQKQGRVKPTTQMNGQPVNDSPSLEQEADVMGARAAQTKRTGP